LNVIASEQMSVTHREIVPFWMNIYGKQGNPYDLNLFLSEISNIF